MRFLIISHAKHYKVQDSLFAYGPYVREMNLWMKYVNEVEIVAPISNDFDANINLAYAHKNIVISEVPAFSLIGLKEKLSTLLKLPIILWTIYQAMRKADHIHLRCPGNMGLLGCLLQVLFPKTSKTAKYAGNWDPQSNQPFSYRIQKFLLRNTILSKKIKVLTYGTWPGDTKNVKPFFTASYFEKDKTVVNIDHRWDALQKEIQLVFVGQLSGNKRPVFSLDVFSALIDRGLKAKLHFLGDGPLREELEQLVKEKNAVSDVIFYGNVNGEKVRMVLNNSHFLIFASRSEGWPKAVAESMWWGCLPITTPVSCVPEMVGDHRGALLAEINPEKACDYILGYRSSYEKYINHVNNAMNWSRQYTLEMFEGAVKELLHD